MVQIVKGGSSLRYLGSPYQTSLSEAGQKKFLYCLSATPNTRFPDPLVTRKQWSEEKRWELDVGRKYFKVIVCVTWSETEITYKNKMSVYCVIHRCFSAAQYNGQENYER